MVDTVVWINITRILLSVLKLCGLSHLTIFWMIYVTSICGLIFLNMNNQSIKQAILNKSPKLESFWSSLVLVVLTKQKSFSLGTPLNPPHLPPRLCILRFRTTTLDQFDMWELTVRADSHTTLVPLDLNV